MICPHRGSVIPDNSAFCAQCGARLAQPTQESASAAEPPAEDAGSATAQPQAHARAAEIAGSVPSIDADDAEKPQAAAAGKAPASAAQAGETQLMPESAAAQNAAPAPAAAAEKTMVVPGAFAGRRSSAAAEEELAQLPRIDEPPADMPPAIPIEGTPVAEPEPNLSDFLPKRPQVPQVPEVPAADKVPDVPEAPEASAEPEPPEPERTEQRMPQAERIEQRMPPVSAEPEPLQTISSAAGATPLLRVPVNTHDTADYRNSVKRRRHARAEAQQSHPFAQTVSRSEYESHMQDESYADAVSEAGGASQRSSSAFRPEEGQSLEEHARRAESALSGGVHVAERRRSKGPIIVAICLICAVAVAGYLIWQNMQASTATQDTAQTETEATTDDTAATTAEEVAPSPVTASDEVSYNSDTGLLTMENYGFSVTLPTGMTAEVSSDGYGLDLTDGTDGVQISAWVKPNTSGATLDELSDEAMNVTNLTYAHVSTLNNWFVVSYWKGSEGYYVREYVDANRILALEFTWQKASETAATQVIDDMTNTISMTGE